MITSLPTIEETLVYPKNDALELDEQWSFVRNKKNKKWRWFAKSRVTKQIVAYFVGNRNQESCENFKNRFPEKYKDIFTFSDLWESYSNVFTENHISAPKGSGETCHIENFNNIIRQRLARYKRKTIAFSKSDYWHDLITRLFIIQYNLL